MMKTIDENVGNPDRQTIASKILIIGLDGATFDVLQPMIDAGYMPHLKHLIDTGASGILNSTQPPITPAAWTTFMTGMGPGRHGIIDFERYDPVNNRLTFNNTFELRHKTLWQMLSESGFRVGSIHLPMTYPPQTVNGFMISGFETPSIDVQFTYPADLKAAILEQMPNYSYSTNWRRSILPSEKVFAENLNYIKNSFDQGVQLARLCGKRHGWDVMMVLLKLVDNLQHKCWRYLDRSNPDRHTRRGKMVAGCLEHLDQCLGQFVQFAHEYDNKALVIVMSDHGHGSLDGRAQPNLLLKRWGYLKLTGAVSQVKTRASYMISRSMGKKAPRFSQPNQGIERDLAIDWPRTKACVMHAGIYGFLYINLKGRHRRGAVDPADYEALRDELKDRLLRARDQTYDRQIFQDVHKPEDLYHCRREELQDLPDLLLVPATGLAVVRKIRGNSAVRWNVDGQLGGTHRVEGILVANGRHVRPGYKLRAEIADITPTILACMGLAVPVDMEGKALTGMFDRPLKVDFQPPRKAAATAAEEVYSDKEKKLLTERLADLGYLE